MKYLKYFENLEKEWSELSNQEKRALQIKASQEIKPKVIDKKIDINNKLVNSVIKLYSKDWQHNFETKDDLQKYLFDSIEEIEKLPSKVILYRVLDLKHSNSINMKVLGNCYVLDKRLLTDEDFLNSIGIYSDRFNNLYCIEILINKQDIDIKSTLGQRLLNPEESEIYINNDVKPLDFKIEKISKDEIY